MMVRRARPTERLGAPLLVGRRDRLTGVHRPRCAGTGACWASAIASGDVDRGSAARLLCREAVGKCGKSGICARLTFPRRRKLSTWAVAALGGVGDPVAVELEQVVAAPG
jgi:hypothetical protein